MVLALSAVACGGGSSYCERAAFLEGGLDAALPPMEVSSEQPTAEDATSVVESIQRARERFDDLAGAAPDDIADEVGELQEVFVALDDAFAASPSEEPEDLLRAANPVFERYQDGAARFRLTSAGQAVERHYARVCAVS